MLVHLIKDNNLDDELSGLEFLRSTCWITDISLISFKLTESLKSQCCQILDLQIKRRNNNLRGKKNLIKQSKSFVRRKLIGLFP